MLCPRPFEFAFVLTALSFSFGQSLLGMANARAGRQASGHVMAHEFHACGSKITDLTESSVEHRKVWVQCRTIVPHW
jgi:hypothetical protein